MNSNSDKVGAGDVAVWTGAAAFILLAVVGVL